MIFRRFQKNWGAAARRRVEIRDTKPLLPTEGFQQREPLRTRLRQLRQAGAQSTFSTGPAVVVGF
jgi:hypothetical protein